MEWLEKNLQERFDLPPKDASEEARRGWRDRVSVVKNPRRRFRVVADPDRHMENEIKRRSTQENIRVALYVQRSALSFIEGCRLKEWLLTEDLIKAGFSINPDELASISKLNHLKLLKMHGGVHGISNKIRSTFDHGISSSDLGTRQNIFGVNCYAEKPSLSFWTFVWDALQDRTLIILMVCSLTSAVFGLASEDWPKGIYEGLGIMLTILLFVMVTAISDYKQSLQLMDLDIEKKKIFIYVTRDGIRKKISIYDLVVGDIVHLSVGDRVPADGLYIHGYSLLIDESSLKGETDPVYISQDRPFIMAGTEVQDGSAKMMVTAVGMRTEWGRLMSTLSEGEDETPLQVKLNGVVSIIGKIGLVFATLTFVVLMVRFLIEKGLTVSLSKWYFTDALTVVNYFATAASIILIGVPEGLPLAVTMSLAFAMKNLMNDKALVRHLSACETMGSAGTICTDKTGTLTTNHMVVDKIWISEVSKSVNSNNSLEDMLNSVISPTTLGLLLQGIFENTSAEVVREKDGTQTVLGTPTERAILEFGLRLQGFHDANDRTCIKLKVEHFNSVKKKMSVLVSLPNGTYCWFTKGASEIIVRMCDMIIDGDGNSVPLSETQRKNILDTIRSFASDALRTLCLAYKEVNDQDVNDLSGDSDSPTGGFTLISIFGIKDPVRPGVKDAVKACMSAGIIVRMVTGDNISTAIAIAKECGILTDDGVAIEGTDFLGMNPEEMRDLIPKIQVLAHSSPFDKHTLVTNLRGMFHQVVAVTGDGVNDAPALHEADTGLAMGITGTEVAKETADVILLDDNFITIINVIRWGRSVYINIQKIVQFQLTVSIVALVINFVSAFFTGSVPLTAAQLLWVNIFTDTLGALALATDPPNDDMMKRPPVRPQESFITKVIWRNIIGQSLYQLVVLGALMFGGEWLLNIKGADSKSVIHTLIFNTFVFFQVFNEINSRNMQKINVFQGIIGNWVFTGIIAVTIAFQVVIIEFLGTFASTVPLNWQLWLVSIGFGSSSLIVHAILNYIPVKSDEIPASPNSYSPLPSSPDNI